MLPALTFRPGTEPSGSLPGTTPINGVTPPFADQPVQGFSGLRRNGHGRGSQGMALGPDGRLGQPDDNR